MIRTASVPFLHVANGTSTTGTIHAAGLPGRSSIWADVLHEGPVPDVPDDRLVEIRARHLAGDDEERLRAVVDELGRWRAALLEDDEYAELVLWFEHDLFDQLNLIQVLSRLATNRPARPVTLICIDAFPGHPDFKGLGELTPTELASLIDTRKAVSDPQYALATRAWAAFRAPDPRRLEALLQTDTTPLPFLDAALRRHLQEFPWTIDGLSRTERRLLTLAESPIDIHAAFPRMHDRERAFYIADGSFWNVASDLASTSPPLLSIEAASIGSAGLPRGTIAATDAGRSVLAGSLDRIELCGLDRWLGGVHLQGSPSAWRWDDTLGRLVSSS